MSSKALIISVIILSVLLVPGVVCAQGQQQQYYVVVGAFAIKKNADRHAENLRARGYGTTVDFNKNRNLYYVWIKKLGEREEAVAVALSLQQEVNMRDAWVYGGNLGAGQPASSPQNEEIILVTRPYTPPKQEVRQEDSPASAVGTSAKKSAEWIFEARDGGKPVRGKIELIEPSTGKVTSSYELNTPVVPGAEATSESNYVISFTRFGYKPYRNDFAFKGEGSQVVSVKLEPLKKGDVVAVKEIVFYTDAAIVVPDGKEKLEDILSYLKENPAARIRINGHTLGTAYTSGFYAKNSDIFSMESASRKLMSPKTLSAERAEAIKTYLTINGIDRNRVETRAWGGMKFTTAPAVPYIEVEIL